ncbi:MAG: helix-turn-helix transcriptional regulator [Clostridia bacterium]|nr:helix-turn-helix transcriptional regulator [Clostridia bacterium]
MKYFELDLNQTLQITMLNHQEFVPPQRHCTRYNPEYILYIVTKGSLCLEANGEPITLLPGDIYCFRKGDFQRPLQCTECEFYYIHFDTNCIRERSLSDEEYCRIVQNKRNGFLQADILGAGCYEYMKVLVRQRYHIENKDFLLYITDVLKNHFLIEHQDIEHRLQLSFLVSGLLLKLEGMILDNLEEGKQENSFKAYYMVRNIAEYIRKNYLQNVSSVDIEKQFAVNFDYANRVFKRIMGVNIVKYRNVLRMNAAKEKLMISDKTISEIAYESGFENRYYFSRYFKKTEGIPPTEYREKMLKEKMMKEQNYEITNIQV